MATINPYVEIGILRSEVEDIVAEYIGRPAVEHREALVLEIDLSCLFTQTGSW
jgi:hypothetical protein